MQGEGVSRQVRDCERGVVDRKEALAFVEPQKLLQDAAEPRSNSGRGSAVKKFTPSEIFRELHREFPGMGSEDQKLQTKNQTGTRMKQTWNFKQRQRRSFCVLTVADAHCPYRIQHPGRDDHYLSFVETLEPTLRRERCMRFLPSFGLAKLIQHLSQARARDH
jgi:hypothetical protein